MNKACDVIDTKGPAAIGQSHFTYPYWFSSKAFCFGAGMRILTPDPGEHHVPKTRGSNIPVLLPPRHQPVELAAASKQDGEVGSNDGVLLVVVPLPPLTAGFLFWWV